MTSTTWTRAKSAFAGKSLFGTTGIRPADIRQGSIGNCWFMAAASAVAEYPGRMEKVFLNNVNEVSSIGVYAVNFFTPVDGNNQMLWKGNINVGLFVPLFVLIRFLIAIISEPATTATQQVNHVVSGPYEDDKIF